MTGKWYGQGNRWIASNQEDIRPCRATVHREEASGRNQAGNRWAARSTKPDENAASPATQLNDGFVVLSPHNRMAVSSIHGGLELAFHFHGFDDQERFV